jgi:hypothetical protein
MSVNAHQRDVFITDLSALICFAQNCNTLARSIILWGFCTSPVHWRVV